MKKKIQVTQKRALADYTTKAMISAGNMAVPFPCIFKTEDSVTYLMDTDI